jgi:asparagine synthase (glutamine-hydrolysing)
MGVKMCGIFGIFSPERPVEETLLRRAADCISYRGPDADGIYLSGDKTVGLAHKRLSILDLSDAARQPMCDDEKSFWIVFNGEIYNFREIRETLSSAGYTFKTSSDTEVLLYAYKKWGRKCLHRLNGMFSFGIFDSMSKKIFLARDRVGKKPLFYSSCGGHFVFSSELKQILRTGFLPAEIDEEALNYYFALGYIPDGLSLVKNVHKLEAGFFLDFDIGSGSISTGRYWDTPDFEHRKNEATMLEELDALLKDSVKSRLVSDVPLGVFLSGGIDSSLVVAYMRRIHNGEIKTFSIGFEGSKKSELKYSAIVARHLETTHQEIVVRPDFIADLEYVSGLMDEPIYDNSLLPTYYLSKHTRQQVTVALSGDGGDEIFGGYVHYASALAAVRLARCVVPPFSKFARYLSGLMPDGAFGKNTLYGLSGSDADCFVYPTLIFKKDERTRLFRRDLLHGISWDAPSRYREEMMKRNYDFVNRMCYADMKTELVNDILVKADRASMFNSLEVRCPLLDYRIADYSFRHIPGNLKIKRGTKKYLLKKLARKYLPAALDLERKQGFDIPGDLLSRTHVTDRLLGFPENEFVSPRFIAELVGKQRAGKGYNWHKLFAAYFFMRWLETWRG